MKVKILMPIISIIFVLTIGLVCAEVTKYFNEETYSLTIDIPDGKWYLVPHQFTLDGCQREMISETEWKNTMNVKARWLYSPTLGSYELMAPPLCFSDHTSPGCFGGQKEDYISPNPRIDQDENDHYLYAMPKGGAVFVYISSRCSLEDAFPSRPGLNSTDEELEPILRQIKMAKGWNFITVTPWMIGRSLNEIKGNCEIDKIAGWKDVEQSWIITLGDDDKLNNPFEMNNIGRGFGVKISDKCNLGLVE